MAAKPATDLANQLQHLAAAQHVNQGRRHMGRASLLYSFQEAADISADTIYRIGLEGFDQLCALDGRFQAYRRTLFGQASVDRDASTAEVNAKLNASIGSFCSLLSSYFLLAPAFKALELLVRKYKVHEQNVEELMLAALPYHETEQFVRLVQILRLDPRGPFAFFEPMQQSGAPAPREAIVLRCITDRSLLRFVCNMAQQQADPRVAGRVVLPFYAVLLCEYLNKMKAVDEPLLTMLLPYLLAGLSGTAIPDYRAATYMIIGQLAARATFSADLATALVSEVCRTASPDLLNSAVMLLAHMANRQEHLSKLPEKAFKQLAKVPGVVDQLEALSVKGCRIDRLLTMLVSSAMELIATNAHYEQLLQALLSRVDMGDAALALADAVLKQAGAADVAEQHQHILQHLLRSLDLRCPDVLDAALAAALPPRVGNQEGQGQGQPGTKSAEEQRQERILAALNAAFEGTTRCPLLEAGTTVLLAAEAPAARVRQLAVQRLDALAMSASNAGSEAAAAAGAALLRRLQDDSPAVVQTVLSSASLTSLPPSALCDGLVMCFNRALQQAGDRSASKAHRAEARGVARKVLKLLAGTVAEGDLALLPHVSVTLLTALLITNACGRKIASTAAKAARRLNHPLLAALGGLLLPEETGGEEQGSKEAKSKKAGAAAAAAGAVAATADVAYNAKVVEALANKVATDQAPAGALAQLLEAKGNEPGYGGAEPLILMVAHAAVRLGGQGAPLVAAALLQKLQKQQRWLPAEGPQSALPSECFLDSGIPTPTLLEQFMAGQLSLPSMRSTVLLAALQAAPWSTTKDVLGLVRTLCALNWKPALNVLVSRLESKHQDAAHLLSDLFAAPPTAEAADVQVVAIQQATALLEQRAAAARGSKKRKETPQQPDPIALLVRALGALCHSDAAVRQAATRLSQACAALLDQGSALTGRSLKVLQTALSEQAEFLAADAESVLRLMEIILAVDGASSPDMQQYVLPAADAGSLGAALLAAAEAEAVSSNGRPSSTGAYTARHILGCVVDWAPAEQLLATCARILSTARPGAPASLEAEQQELLLVEAASCFTAPRVETLLKQESKNEAAEFVLDTWCTLLEPAGTAGTAACRLAALQQINGQAFALLPEALQGRCLQALLRGASKDADEGCRSAARAALEALPLHANLLLPLLKLDTATSAGAGKVDIDMQDASELAADEADEQLQQLQAAAAKAAAAAAKLGTPRAKQRRGKASDEQAAAEEAARAAAAAVDQRRQQLAQQRLGRQQFRLADDHQQLSAVDQASDKGAEGCVATLELLQWKQNVQQQLLLVPALQELLEQLLAELSRAEAAEGEDAEEQLPAPATAGMAPAEAVYVMQLCLSALSGIAKEQQAGSLAVPHPPVTPSKAKARGHKQPAGGMEAFDLGLAVRAAQLTPDGAVRNAALELIAQLATSMPQAALMHVLDVLALVGDSAALYADEHSERMASQALHAILPAWTAAGKSLHQLAATFVATLPRVSPHRRLLLLSALVAALPEVEGLCNVVALLLDRAVNQQAGSTEEQGTTAAHAMEDPAWAADVAGELMAQAPMLVQAAASASLLKHSMDLSKQQPWQPLPLLSVAFVTQQLEQRQRAASTAAAEDLTAAYKQLMHQSLLQLEKLGEQQAAQQQSRKAGARASLVRAGTAGCYRLLRALQQHMPPAAFLSALVSLASSTPADRIRRKALQLMVAAVQDGGVHDWQQDQQPTDAHAAVAEAAMAACRTAVQLLEASEPKGSVSATQEAVSPLTRQTALALIATIAGTFGQQHPDQLLSALPGVLSAVRDARPAVRGSALAAVAAVAVALGPRLVPLLPKTVGVVIQAVQSAAAVVTKAAAARQKGHGEADADSADGSSGSDAEEESADAELSKAVSLELAASLTAVTALVQHLGAFLAPHIPALLGVLLHPTVLQCSAARCADVAATIRQQLAKGVPTRLLLPPLLAHLDIAAQDGAESLCGLLRMLSWAVDAMDASALTSHYEAVFGALLRALDLRRRRPTALLTSRDDLDQTEAAAVACFVTLTMRLSEARFKPLFFWLLEWAHAVPAADSALPAGTAQLLRSMSVFTLVNALADRLRSVFVPYYGLLLDACVAHLTDGSVAAAKQSKKAKRKSSGAVAAAADGKPSDDPLYVEHDWRLRLKVVRALHRCFLYDTGAAAGARFLDEARFQRLLAPLVAHLGVRPPASVAEALEGDGGIDGAADLEASLQLASSGDGDGTNSSALLDPFGRAVVACLAQLAVTAGSDTLWKPLNHQVLMMTRSLEPRTRMLALETVAQLVGRLSEEYLALLPETLPFLAELLEDAELEVEAGAQRLVKQLEQLSGEPLDQYLR